MRILIAVYVLAINVYSFFLIKFQRDSFEEGDCKTAVQDGKLFITALLGGATGIYVAMLSFKYRMKSLLLMVIMPVVIVLNGYAIFLAFTADFLLGRDYASHITYILAHLSANVKG